MNHRNFGNKSPKRKGESGTYMTAAANTTPKRVQNLFSNSCAWCISLASLAMKAQRTPINAAMQRQKIGATMKSASMNSKLICEM